MTISARHLGTAATCAAALALAAPTAAHAAASPAYCTTGHSVQLLLQKFDTAPTLRRLQQVGKALDAAVPAAHRAAPGATEKKHLAALGAHLDQLVVLAKGVGSHAPTRTQSARIASVSRSYYRDADAVAADLGRNGCQP